LLGLGLDVLVERSGDSSLEWVLSARLFSSRMSVNGDKIVWRAREKEEWLSRSIADMRDNWGRKCHCRRQDEQNYDAKTDWEGFW
jgi:hypothetical protein